MTTMQIFLSGGPETLCLDVTNETTLKEIARATADKFGSSHDVVRLYFRISLYKVFYRRV